MSTSIESLQPIPPWVITWIDQRWRRGVLITYLPRNHQGTPIQLPIGAVTAEQFAVVTEDDQILVFNWGDVVVLQIICIDRGEFINYTQIRATLPRVGENLTEKQLKLN